MKTTPRQGIMPPQVARHLPTSRINAALMQDEYSSGAITDGLLENLVIEPLQAVAIVRLLDIEAKSAE